MSINENMEFEAINQKTRERTESVGDVRKAADEILKEIRVRTITKAIASMAAVMVALVIILRGITALETIGWINSSFQVVLMCVAGGVAAFMQGYFWHEIKN